MRVALAIAICLATMAAVPHGAAAHVHATGTAPSAGRAVEEAPTEVVIVFNKPFDWTQAAIEVTGPGGQRFDEGGVRPSGDRGIAVDVRPDAPPGAYRVDYRVIADDGHIMRDGFDFSVEAPPAAAGAAIAEPATVPPAPPAPPDAGSAAAEPAPVAVAARWLRDLGIAVAVGILVFTVAVWRRVPPRGAPAERAATRRSFDRVVRALVIAAATAGALGTLIGLAVFGAAAAEVPPTAALGDPAFTDALLGTRYGTVSMLLAAALLLLAVAAALGVRLPARRPVAALTVAVLALGLSVAAVAAGHFDFASWPSAVAAAHVLAASVWIGGIFALATAVPVALRTLPPGERSGAWLDLLARFSPIALLAVLVVVGAGVAVALTRLDDLAQLTQTDYGRALLVKSALLAAILVAASAHRLRHLPVLDRRGRAGAPLGQRGRDVRRTLVFEVAGLVAVLAVTAVLAGTDPSVDGDRITGTPPIASEAGP